jgi:hypothetical protein
MINLHQSNNILDWSKEKITNQQMDINSIQVYKIEKTFKDGNKIQWLYKPKQDGFASSTKLMKVFWDTWIFSPCALNM